VPKTYFEDYRLGEDIRSPGRTVTESDVVAYGMFTGDWEATEACLTRKRGVPDLFVSALSICLLLRAGRDEHMAHGLVAFYGFDEIAFLSRVAVGDTLHSVAHVERMRIRNEEGGIVEFSHRCLNQDNRVTLQTYHSALFRRTPSQVEVEVRENDS
jgi:acyl dehydratase